MGGMYVTLWLVLGQESLMDLHWESHLVQNMKLMEDPLVIYQVENFRVKNWDSLVLRYAHLVIFQV